MSDPLSQIVGLLRPTASFAKVVVAGGRWTVRRSDDERPFYCAMIEGSCRLSPSGQDPVLLAAGDFVLVPAVRDFSATSVEPPPCRQASPISEVEPGVFRLGDAGVRPDVRMLVGHCAFASPDAHLLVSLLPGLVHVRGQARLTTLVDLVNGETRARRPGRDPVLSRLLEVLLIEALRSAGEGSAAPPGLLRGLADERVAAAMRRMHDDPARAWTVAELAAASALSRSSFFDRFTREVGVAPMTYLLAWRMALAKDLLRRGEGVGEIAGQVGYASAATFGIAFARHVGRSPAHYRRERPPGEADAPDREPSYSSPSRSVKRRSRL